MFAQYENLGCATPPLVDSDIPEGYSNSTDSQLLMSYDPIVFNVYYWGINEDDGTAPGSPNDISITEERALRSIQMLNISFNKHNIYFKYTGFETFNNSLYYEISGHNEPGYKNFSELLNFAQSNNNQYYKTNAINIYIFKPYDFAGIALRHKNAIGMHQYFGQDFSRIGLNAHEMGHNLGLWHPHDGFMYPYVEGNPYNTSCEVVNRNSNNGQPYNADIAGDRVVDTQAAPDFRKEHYWELVQDFNVDPEEAEEDYTPYLYYNQGNCEWQSHQNGIDCLGEPYDIQLDYDNKNIMSYAPWECVNDILFTPGQLIKMRETIQIDENGHFALSENSIASLYEPYKGEYYIAGPSNPAAQKPLFQPGFEYRFVNCDCYAEEDCSSPTPYEEGNSTFSSTTQLLLSFNKEEPNFDNITHPNHSAIKIIFPNLPTNDPLLDPKRCYDNWNKAAIGGSLTKFNDNVFNTNVTLYPQDSASINNPNLINTIDPGLYKIEKVYEDGAIQQSVIIKGNQ